MSAAGPLIGAAVGAIVGSLAAKRDKKLGALIGGGLGLGAGLIANSIAGQFGAALGGGIGSAQNSNASSALTAAETAAALTPLIAAKKVGAAGCSTCSQRKKAKITSIASNPTSTSLSELPATRDSCLECVEKHLGSAAILASEVRDGYDEHYILAVGSLDQAAEESQAWPELHNAIREARKAYQSQGIAPDLKSLSKLAGSIRMSSIANEVAA